MPIDSTSVSNLVFNSFILIKIGFVILSILYFIFSLIVLQQVRLITETVVTEGGSILLAIAIIYAGLSLGAIVLFIGFL